ADLHCLELEDHNASDSSAAHLPHAHANTCKPSELRRSVEFRSNCKKPRVHTHGPVSTKTAFAAGRQEHRFLGAGRRYPNVRASHLRSETIYRGMRITHGPLPAPRRIASSAPCSPPV